MKQQYMGCMEPVLSLIFGAAGIWLLFAVIGGGMDFVCSGKFAAYMAKHPEMKYVIGIGSTIYCVFYISYKIYKKFKK